MESIDVAGQVFAGKVGKILIRRKSTHELELGDLMVVEDRFGYLILRVNDLIYGSQIPQGVRELAAGLNLEGYGASLDFLEPHLRNYVIAQVKAVASVRGRNVKIPKTLPALFSSLRLIRDEDLVFLSKPPDPIYLGKVRSGSKVLDVDVYLNGTDVLTHHILVPATTGRGKSNLVKVMLWSILDNEKFGLLVLDPHDEYYGRYSKGLKDHPKAKENLAYYSSTPFIGTNTMIINLKSVMPWHFDGIVSFTQAQDEAIGLYYKKFREDWIENIVRGTQIQGVGDQTIAVLKRKFDHVLGAYIDDLGNFQCRSKIFSDRTGETVIKEMVRKLESGKTVIMDTSRLLDEAELLIGSIVCNEIFYRYQNYKSKGELVDRPVISVVIEEAPRVLSSNVIEAVGENIYSTIAREGRKFKVGLIAITQLTSLIPKTVLANMNTKIILGNEMAMERNAVIESAAQDLSDDDRTIASLDKGEAIVSSSFTKFAIPIQIPLFEDLVHEEIEESKVRRKFVG